MASSTPPPPPHNIEPQNEPPHHGQDPIDINKALSTSEEVEDAKQAQNYATIDAELAGYISSARITIDAATNAALRRKVDARILSVMVATYFLQAIDKGTMSFASIMGIRDDTQLVGQQYQWLTTCIYLVILIVEYPQNWIIARVPLAKYLSFSIVAWGTVLACTAACTDFTGLVVVRSLLGLFESACQPAFILLSSVWYRREEQAARVIYWYMMNGAQQIVGGLLAYCFTLISTGPLKSWQWLFLGYGIISIFFGFFVLWWMPDSPMRAKCFTEDEKHLLVERVRDNQTGVQNREWKAYQVVEALKDPQVWGYALIALCTTLPTSGLGSFQGIIIESLGFTTLQTQLLAMVLGAYIIIVLLSSLWLVNRFQQNLIVMLVYLVPCYIGTICLMTVPLNTRSQQIGLLVSYYITYSFWSAQTLALSMISRNVAGQTKKSVAIAVNFIIWSTGNAIGPQVFLTWDGPRYFIAFATHIGCYSLLVIDILLLRWYLTRQNRKRDELAAQGVRDAKDEAYVHAFEDKTDKENPNFRYVY